MKKDKIKRIANSNKVRLLLNQRYRKSFNQVKKYFCEINDSKKEELYKCLSEHFFSRFKNGYLDSDIGKNDMENHISRRLFRFRTTVIPWINTIISLKQSKILEIGCGTGSFTVPLAEQGCELTSIDVDDISVARKRCELYGLPVKLLPINALSVNEINDKFDMIIFSATLEHMTYDERLVSIKLAWDMLSKNGFLVVIDTPNRLYFYDDHSSILPFYHWLPDQIAMKYSKFSPRDMCKDIGCDEMKFMRFGRGASFHEFELALNIKCSDMEVYDMRSFLKTLASVNTKEFKYSNFLRKFVLSDISNGFYHSYLDIAIKKRD